MCVRGSDLAVGKSGRIRPAKLRKTGVKQKSTVGQETVDRTQLSPIVNQSVKFELACVARHGRA